MKKAYSWILQSFVLLAILAVSGISLLGLVYYPYPAEGLFFLLVGWIPYSFLIMPWINANLLTILSALLLLSVCTVGCHLLCRRLQQQRETRSAPGPWPVRRTLVIAMLCVAFALAGMTGINGMYQIQRLFTDPKPLVRNRNYYDHFRSSQNLKQFLIASHCRLSSEDKHFPPASRDGNGTLLHGWATELLPYIEEGDLYKKLDRKVPWNHPRNQAALRKKVRPYLQWNLKQERNARGYALMHYSGNSHIFASGKKWALEDIADGTANTILNGEIAYRFEPWGYPANWRDPALGINQSHNGFGNRNQEGAVMGMADGSVRFVHQNMSKEVLKAVATPSGGELLSKEW